MSKKKELTFAQARARLDEILDEVEGEGGDVDQLAARVREASELIRFCRDRLSAARAEVTRVVADLSAVERSVAADEAGSDGDDAEAYDADDGGDSDADDDTSDDDDHADDADDANDAEHEVRGTARRARRPASGGELPF